MRYQPVMKIQLRPGQRGRGEESIIAGGSLDEELNAQEATSETSNDGCASEPSTARDVQGVHLEPGALSYSFALELPKLPLFPAEFTLPDWLKFIPRRVLMPTEISRSIFAHLDANAAAAASATGDRATGSGTSAANDGPPNLWCCTIGYQEKVLGQVPDYQNLSSQDQMSYSANFNPTIIPTARMASLSLTSNTSSEPPVSLTAVVPDTSQVSSESKEACTATTAIRDTYQRTDH